RGGDVRSHVVLPLFLVLVVGAFGREPRQKRLQIPPHGRVGVLLDDQRGAGVLYADVAQSRPDTGDVHDATDGVGHVVETSPARLEADRFLVHFQAGSHLGECGASTRPRSLSWGRKRPLYSSEGQPSTR